MTIWQLKEKSLGCGYTIVMDGTTKTGEAVDFGYTATLEAGTLDVPDSVSVILADDPGDTASKITVAGVVTAAATGYSVAAVLGTTSTAALSGKWYYEVKELRDTNASYPYGGCLWFDEKVEG